MDAMGTAVFGLVGERVAIEISALNRGLDGLCVALSSRKAHAAMYTGLTRERVTNEAFAVEELGKG